jgi:integrase
MTVCRLTQGTVDRLLSGPAPARDVHLWSDRESGFGLKRAAGSRRTAWVYQWRCPMTGRSHRLTLGDAAKVTLADARAAMAARAGEIAAGKNPIAERKRHRASLTFAELVARYLKSDAWARKAPSTKAGDARRIALYLVPALGSRKLVEIELDDLRRLHRSLGDPAAAEALARKAGATKNTRRGGDGGARRSMRLLKAIFAFAVEDGQITTHPAAGLKLGSDGCRETAPDDDDYARLWQALEGQHGPAHDIIRLLLLTGARKSEIRLLRWRHLDLAGRRIVLPRDEHKSGRKTGKNRVISLPPEAMEIIARYPRGLPDAFVFMGRNGGPVALQRAWERLARAAGLAPGLTLHSLRHGVGSALAAAGRTAPQIAMQLGHSSWRMSERYCHGRDKARHELAAVTAALVRPRLQAVA